MQVQSAIAVQTTGDASLAALLATAAKEVDGLSDVAQRLHDLIARHIGGAGIEAQSIEDAQMIDYLVQHLEALGAFLDCLARETPEHLNVDATSARAGLRLADLARRLVGGGDGPDARSTPSGDCELF